MQGHDLSDLTLFHVKQQGWDSASSFGGEIQFNSKTKKLLHWKMWSNALQSPHFLIVCISNFWSESKSASGQNDSASSDSLRDILPEVKSNLDCLYLFFSTHFMSSLMWCENMYYSVRTNQRAAVQGFLRTDQLTNFLLSLTPAFLPHIRVLSQP